MAEVTPKGPTRQFKFFRTSFTRHYDIKDSSGAPLYYVDQTAFAHDRPDLTFHSGNSGKGPVAAVCHIPAFGGDMKMGLGDPNTNNIKWEEMTKETKVTASEYRFSFELQGGRTNFAWKRTHSEGVDGDKPSMTLRNWKLVDLSAAQPVIVAVFTSDRGWSTCGTLQTNVQNGDEFDLMLLTTCLSLYEKARKRAARSATGGGGGGGP